MILMIDNERRCRVAFAVGETTTAHGREPMQ
jgi:hypothetical protein